MDDETFIRQIVDAPSDEAIRLEYAQWLAGHGDPRGRFLSAEATWAEFRTAEAEIALRALASTLDPVWISRVSRPPVGVCADHLRFLDRGLSRPALTPADLEQIETRFGLTLPSDYRAYLLNHNGKCPEPGHLRIEGRPYDAGCYDQVTALHIVWSAVDSEIDRDDDLVYYLELLVDLRATETDGAEDAVRWQAKPHRNWMVIGNGPPNGELDWLCLGCRGSDLGKVFFAAPSLVSPEEEDYCFVAPTFAAFLAMLTDHDPHHIQAIKRGDVAMLRRWLDAGGNPDELYHNTPLVEHAMFARQPDAMRELLARGARVYSRTRDYARSTGSAELVDLLAR